MSFDSDNPDSPNEDDDFKDTRSSEAQRIAFEVMMKRKREFVQKPK